MAPLNGNPGGAPLFFLAICRVSVSIQAKLANKIDNKRVHIMGLRFPNRPLESFIILVISLSAITLGIYLLLSDDGGLMNKAVENETISSERFEQLLNDHQSQLEGIVISAMRKYAEEVRQDNRPERVDQ